MKFQGLVLRIVLGYSVKSFVELPHPSSPVLSPFDYEHIVLTDYVLQPEITPAGIIGESVFIKTPECESAVYVSRDRVVCKAESGFSHLVHGVAVVKTSKSYRTITASEAFDRESVVYAKIPGTFIVACYDCSSTHIITANYTGVFVFRDVYSGEETY